MFNDELINNEFSNNIFPNFLEENNIKLVQHDNIILDLDRFKNQTAYVLYKVNKKTNVERINGNSHYLIEFPLLCINYAYQKIFSLNDRYEEQRRSYEYFANEIRKIISLSKKQINPKYPYLVKGLFFHNQFVHEENIRNEVRIHKKFGLVLYEEENNYYDKERSFNFY